MKLNANLVRGKSPDEIKELEARLQNAAPVIREFISLLTEELNRGTITIEGPAFFAEPHWEARVAWTHGGAAKLRWGMELLHSTIDPKVDKA